MAENKPQVRVASIEVELGMSVQNKAGIWCKPSSMCKNGVTVEELVNTLVNSGAKSVIIEMR